MSDDQADSGLYPFNCIQSYDRLTAYIPYRPNTQTIGDDTLSSVADSYLKIGETVFDMIQGTAVNSQYLKRDDVRR